MKILNSITVVVICASIIGMGYIIPHSFESIEVHKDCESQEIIINQTSGSIFISCLPAKGGTIIGDRNVTYVD